MPRLGFQTRIRSLLALRIEIRFSKWDLKSPLGFQAGFQSSISKEGWDLNQG